MLIKIHKMRYSVDYSTNECMTRCRFKKNKFVGSLECRICPCFFERNLNCQYVVCGYPNTIIVKEGGK